MDKTVILRFEKIFVNYFNIIVSKKKYSFKSFSIIDTQMNWALTPHENCTNNYLDLI